jgi:heme-degrading monooxygenase HmoA
MKQMAEATSRRVPLETIQREDELGPQGAPLTSHYASGNWVVDDGRQIEFIERWREFLEWTRVTSAGLRSAQLIQDVEDPRHFISFAGWESAEAMRAWRSLPEFAQKLNACRELCDDFSGSSYTVAATV